MSGTMCKYLSIAHLDKREMQTQSWPNNDCKKQHNKDPQASPVSASKKAVYPQSPREYSDAIHKYL
jgi:hypothetical protein